MYIYALRGTLNGKLCSPPTPFNQNSGRSLSDVAARDQCTNPLQPKERTVSQRCGRSRPIFHTHPT